MRVKITESRLPPNPEDRNPTHHQVFVGSDEEGWMKVPYVTDVDLNLRQGELRKAVITVLFPQVDFEGGHPHGN